MKILSRYTIIVLLVLSTLSCAASEVGKLLKTHFLAVGGLERLTEIKTVQRSGTATLKGSFGEITGNAEEVVIVGKKSYSKIDFAGGIETTIWNGTEGWRTSTTDDRTDLSDDELEFAKSAVFIDPLQGLYAEYGNSAFRQDEDETFNGKACAVIRIVGSEVVFYIDKTSHLINGMKTPYNDPDLGDTTMTIGYADYAEYGGVMFPDSLNIRVEGGTGTGGYIYECAYTKTTIDATVDKAMFEKPK